MRITKADKTTVEASNWASTKKVFDTHGGDTQLNDRSGQVVEVIRPLTGKEVDLADVGPMFKVRFEDGYETDAFEDELSDITSCKASTSTDKALQHIKAAIDILGKSGDKSAVAMDSIANLSVVMFDLKSKK